MPSYNILNTDAFDFLNEFPNDSIDLIVSSPPYFMGKEYDRSKDVTDFVDEHVKLASLLFKALKPGGSLCWQVGAHVENSTYVPLDALVYNAFSSQALSLRNRIIWTFGHGEHAKKRFSGRYESIMWYTKGENYHFDLDKVRVPQKYPGKRHYKGPRKGEFSGHPLGKNPSDVWDIPNVKAGHVEKTAHPCQFPVALVQRLVRGLSPPDGLVADPFMGSGSTGVAALIEGRNFVGSEISAEYCKIAEIRLQEALNGTARYRSIDMPIYEPGAEAVAVIPQHFVDARSYISEQTNDSKAL